ncbi:sigma-70 family RNA polymerase sigma factor [Pedobacter sp. HMF7647]|uniref:Sigma-70 family RNA polymerase sigma factor n=1 Tax=Hufsiella arboris TaxID=2695275 RepID=A0A7K1Y5X3_9SPHI|nr:sigma-70 family RNA polymerase sigma factor [Hufsiella arboris]MXV49973.1 sigma-70 family RNA polymerase sigma factor [Hufsiella arboris]
MEAVFVDQHYNLVVECKHGSRKAQYELYKLYSKAMYNVAMRIVNDTAEAADVLQDAFVDAFGRILDFRQETTFGLWMKQIVINKSISQLRKRKMELVALDETNVEDVADEEQSDDTEIQYQVQQVKKAIQMLPDGYRVVLSLYLLEGYDHEEIAHILKISENTSRTQFMRAKRKLIEMLKHYGISYN